MTPLLEARRLVKSLGGRRVVDGVDLQCHRGEILGLLGPNGAGKTTTLRMLYGFLRPDAGTIRFDGIDAGADLTRVKRHLGVVLGSALVGYVADHLSYGAGFAVGGVAALLGSATFFVLERRRVRLVPAPAL